MPNCGDKAHIKFKVSSELVGKLGTVTIDRLGRQSTITVTDVWKIDRTQVTFEWPDQQKPSSTDYFGGRKVDWNGLNKEDYKTKFAAQEFEVTLKVGKSGKKSSKQVKIDPFPDVGAVHRQVGFAMNINQGTAPLAVGPTGAVVPMYPFTPAQQASWVTQNCGNFWIEYKEGLVIITVKVRLHTTNPGKVVDDRVFNHFKNNVECFWNGPDGFRQWVFHNKKCLRKQHCNCPVLFKAEASAKEKLLLGGCCKFPIRVNIEKGADNPVHVDFMTPAEVQNIYLANLATGGSAPAPYDFHTMNVCYPQDIANSYAHEVGHMMGFPDEYGTGTPTLSTPAVPGGTPLFPVTADSIMGTNMTRAYQRHFEWGELARNWVNSNVTAVTAINRNP